jgi:nicotinamide-nucleotide amidase
MTHVELIAKALALKKMTLCTAESCTGGLVAHTLTNLSGSSAFFTTGFITYADAAKSKFLDISPGLIEKNGAVSAPVSKAMAQGARKAAGTDFALSLTGIAGPTGGTLSKPVGLVFITATSARKTVVRRFLFKGTRLQIKRQATTAALNMLLRIIP